MAEQGEARLRIDETGAVHPVGPEARRRLLALGGELELLPAPPRVMVARAAAPGEAAEAGGPSGFWLAGAIVKPGALWDLVGLIGQGSWSGELCVHGEGGARSLYFEAGHVVAAHSTAEKERLGEVLFSFGAMTREQVARTLRAVTPQKRFGEAAVELGFIGREDLFRLLGKQIEEIVFAVMAVRAGSFYFVDHFDEARLPYRVSVAITGLLMEGARRLDEMQCFRARIPSADHVPARVPGHRFDPDAEHGALYQSIDGARSIAELGRILGQGEFETTLGVFHLLQAGVACIQPPRAGGPAAIVELFNEAMRLILGAVDALGPAPGRDARSQLASFASASGAYDLMFRGAGPAADGAVEAQIVADNVVAMAGPEEAEVMLAQSLYEYASFAMFIAEPLLRASGGDADMARRVATVLAPLASAAP
ncbi:MAG: DUF4388 domain-containing protein [Deltaproteobacteria bacterium]|nr:DUF4388 domain-containing protein [Deltaproteobacteria bacterium]